MRTVALGDLVDAVSSWNPSRKPDIAFTYIDLSAVDSTSKTIKGPVAVLGAEAPSRARQLVATRDVLVSTVRPNLNAVAVVPATFDGATASTGFTVLRPGRHLDSRYLFHWVRSPSFIGDMVRKATGASYPAVSDRIVKESLIPLPPLPEQRRVAAILDRADALRAKRRQVLAHLDALTQSIFHDMFGDPDRAADDIPFGAVASLTGGRNLVAGDPTSAADYRVLKISAVTSGQFKPWESKPLPQGYVPPTNHLVRAGDLLMSRANTAELVGAVALVDSAPANLALPDKIWRFEWRIEAEPIFWHALLSTGAIRRRISGLASGTGGSMKNVAKAKLEAMPVPRIGIHRQREFANRSHQLVVARRSATAALAADDELFASLQARAFDGRL